MPEEKTLTVPGNLINAFAAAAEALDSGTEQGAFFAARLPTEADYDAAGPGWTARCYARTDTGPKRIDYKVIGRAVNEYGHSLIAYSTKGIAGAGIVAGEYVLLPHVFCAALVPPEDPDELVPRSLADKALVAIAEGRVRVIKASGAGIALAVTASAPDSATLRRKTYRTLVYVCDDELLRECSCPALKRCYHVVVAEMLWRPRAEE